MKRILISEYVGCDGTYVRIPAAILLHKYFNSAKRRKKVN